MKNLTDVSQSVIKAFSDQLDEVKKLKQRVQEHCECDPFAKGTSISSKMSESTNSDEHMRMLRLGNDMIDNMFGQMHQIIDKAKKSLQDVFKRQLVAAFQFKFEK